MSKIDNGYISLGNNQSHYESYDINRTLRANKLYTSNDINKRFDKFFRIGYLDKVNVISGSKEYIFFTRPNLYLFDSRKINSKIPKAGNVDIRYLHPSIQKNSPKLCALFNESPHLFYQLSRQHYSGNNFIPFLTNTVSSNLDLPTIEAVYSEMGKTTNGAMRSVRHSSYQSNNEFTFSLEFTDNKYLEVYKLATIYDEYMNIKASGLLDIFYDSQNPTNPLEGEGYDYQMMSDLLNNIDSSLFTIYRIIVSDDGETILNLAKLWGVSISGVPRDSITNLGNDSKITIPLEFKAEHVEDNNPLIITDFNAVSAYYTIGGPHKPYAKLYDTHLGMVSGELVGSPFIEVNHKTGNAYVGSKSNDSAVYKLRWKID